MSCASWTAPQDNGNSGSRRFFTPALRFGIEHFINVRTVRQDAGNSLAYRKGICAFNIKEAF
jgi:hypothetical protein